VLELFLSLRRLLSQPLCRGDRGATAVEYCLVVA
jgi:Flp pilus assembly pilin Flp